MTSQFPHHQRRRLRVKIWLQRNSFKLVVAIGQIMAFFRHLFGD